MKKKTYISKNKIQLLQKLSEAEVKSSFMEEDIKARICKKIKKEDEAKKNTNEV